MTTGILRTKPNSMRTVLAADIGGTYTRMSLVEIGRPWKNLSIMRANEKFINSDFSSIDAIISSFLDKVPLEFSRPSSACFAVAGPCVNDVGQLTNGGGWIVNGNDIADKYGMNSVKVVNDFVACGYGLLTLNDEEDCCVIQVIFV
jgi:glucokinase